MRDTCLALACCSLALVLCVARCGSAQEKGSAPAAGHADAPAHADAKGHADAPAGGHAADSHPPDAHGHGAHDETDLSHGNATAAISQPQEWRFDLSIFTFIVFLLLLAILYKFAWGPIATALQRREETIARQIEEAKTAADRAAAQLKEYEARLAAATDEARQIVASARKDAELAKDKIVAEARDAAGRERERAVADINIAKNQALDAIAQKSVQTAVSLAGQLIRREVKPQEHEALIGDAINQFSKLN